MNGIISICVIVCVVCLIFIAMPFWKMLQTFEYGLHFFLLQKSVVPAWCLLIIRFKVQFCLSILFIVSYLEIKVFWYLKRCTWIIMLLKSENSVFSQRLLQIYCDTDCCRRSFLPISIFNNSDESKWIC